MAFPTIKLPERALTLAPNVISMPRAVYFSLPVLIALTAFMAVSEAPGILRDWTINQNPVSPTSGDISNGKCTTRKGFFTTCEAHLKYAYNGQTYDKDVEIMFVDIHAGDYDTDLVISGDHPELATMSLGLDMLWNRIITLAVFVALLGGTCIAVIFQILRVWRVRRQLHRAARLEPVPVEITAFQRRGKRLTVTYADKIEGRKTGRTAHTNFEHGQEPLIVGEKGGKAVALAIWHGNTALPVLLDDRLERVDMTMQERAGILAPLTAELGTHPPELVVQRKKGPSIMARLARVLLVIILIIAGIFGYWVWYVTSASSQFTSPAMDINNMMPAPLNRWGCDQLKKRFGDQRAPFGCTASDYTSWK
jgi:TRAP-type C4-dicarboxylate transport system permease small subunit